MSTRGTCLLCGNTYTQRGMYRHLEACKARKAEDENAPRTRLFHLAVKGTYAKDYWMHLEVTATATLRDLDQFLRDTWLECCGHLSQFTIGRRRFVSVTDGWWNSQDRDMDVELGRILRSGLEFSHEYDFGSTTHLDLRVVSDREGVAGEVGSFRILARNEPLDHRCQECGELATEICVFCDYTLLCEECADTHACGIDGLLPVVNSPRMGVCGYTGDVW